MAVPSRVERWRGERDENDGAVGETRRRRSARGSGLGREERRERRE